MNPIQSSRTNALRRYLLGESSAEERSAVERRIMTDQEYLNELSRVEEELIDEYVRGDLEDQEKEEFESLFLPVPERREKIAFAQAFNRYLARHPLTRPESRPEQVAHHSSWQRFAMGSMAAAVVLLALTSGFLYWRMSQTGSQLASAESQRAAAEKDGKTISEQLAEQQKRNAELQQEIAALHDATPEPAPEVITLALTSGWTRGNNPMPAVSLSPGKKPTWLRLNLTIGKHEPQYHSYQVQVRTVEGKEVWTKNGVETEHKNETGHIVFTLPTSFLVSGDYLVVLNGAASEGKPEEAGTYYFRAIRR